VSIPTSDPITVACVDNHAVVRQGVEAHLLRVAPDIKVVASTESVEELLALGVSADVVLLDLILREDVSTGWIPRLTAAGSKVVVYTTEERPVPLRATVAAGALGVLLKSDSLRTVVDGIRMAAAGEFCVSGPLAHALVTDETLVVELSDQQRQVLQCLDEGLDYRATGRVMGISEGTVKTYLARIRVKFRTSGLEPGNSHHLTRQAFEQGHLR
jgi:DNA-binding NarL/FixJ family response regulator